MDITTINYCLATAINSLAEQEIEAAANFIDRIEETRTPSKDVEIHKYLDKWSTKLLLDFAKHQRGSKKEALMTIAQAIKKRQNVTPVVIANAMKALPQEGKYQETYDDNMISELDAIWHGLKLAQRKAAQRA